MRTQNKISGYRKQLRAHPTQTERALRKEFRKNRLTVSFQKKLGFYIYDFCIPRIKVLIEVDGSWHDRPEQKIRDLEKDKFAIKCGYKLIRVKNKEIEKDIKNVLENILVVCGDYGVRRKRFFTRYAGSCLPI